MANAQDNMIGLSPQDKMIGIEPVFVVGTGAYTLPTGQAAYACSCRIDATQISSITPAGGAAISNKTWQNVALNNGEYIPIPIPITSITINTTLGVVLWIQSYKI